MAEGTKTTGQPTDAIGGAAMATGNPTIPVAETFTEIIEPEQRELVSQSEPKNNNLSFFDRFYLNRMETKKRAEKEEKRIVKERKESLDKSRGGKHEYLEKMDYLNREKYLHGKAIIWQWRLQNYAYPVFGMACFLGIVGMFAFSGIIGLLVALICGILAASSFACAGKFKDKAALHQNNMHRLGGVNYNDQGGELLEAKRDFDTHNNIKKNHFEIKRDEANIEKFLQFLIVKCDQVHGGISSLEVKKLAAEADAILKSAQENLTEMKAALSTMQTNVKDRPNQDEKKWENEAKVLVENAERKVDALRTVHADYRKRLENRHSEESLAGQLGLRPIVETAEPERQA